MCHSYSFNSKKLRNEKYVNEIYAHLCQGYIKRALELGFIKEKDIEHVKKELNPYKEMYILV